LEVHIIFGNGRFVQDLKKQVLENVTFFEQNKIMNLPCHSLKLLRFLTAQLKHRYFHTCKFQTAPQIVIASKTKEWNSIWTGSGRKSRLLTGFKMACCPEMTPALANEIAHGFGSVQYRFELAVFKKQLDFDRLEPEWRHFVLFFVHCNKKPEGLNGYFHLSKFLSVASIILIWF
jgi:hypothetical protein